MMLGRPPLLTLPTWCPTLALLTPLTPFTRFMTLLTPWQCARDSRWLTLKTWLGSWKSPRPQRDSKLVQRNGFSLSALASLSLALADRSVLAKIVERSWRAKDAESPISATKSSMASSFRGSRESPTRMASASESLKKDDFKLTRKDENEKELTCRAPCSTWP